MPMPPAELLDVEVGVRYRPCRRRWIVQASATRRATTAEGSGRRRPPVTAGASGTSRSIRSRIGPESRAW
jgi:hypothetical protein